MSDKEKTDWSDDLAPITELAEVYVAELEDKDIAPYSDELFRVLTEEHEIPFTLSETFKVVKGRHANLDRAGVALSLLKEALDEYWDSVETMCREAVASYTEGKVQTFKVDASPDEIPPAGSGLLPGSIAVSFGLLIPLSKEESAYLAPLWEAEKERLWEIEWKHQLDTYQDDLEMTDDQFREFKRYGEADSQDHWTRDNRMDDHEKEEEFIEHIFDGEFIEGELGGKLKHLFEAVQTARRNIEAFLVGELVNTMGLQEAHVERSGHWLADPTSLWVPWRVRHDNRVKWTKYRLYGGYGEAEDDQFEAAMELQGIDIRRLTSTDFGALSPVGWVEKNVPWFLELTCQLQVKP